MSKNAPSNHAANQGAKGENFDVSAIEALPPLRDVINDHNLRAEKSLGQNFLLDLNLTAKIARLAGDLSDKDCIEIGPGPGGLTRGILLQAPRSLTAFEKDKRVEEALADLRAAAQGRLSLIEADALKQDVTAYGKDGVRIIIANLPYNIATPLLLGWLNIIHQRGKDGICKMVLMFQKEVGDRILATHGDKLYGRLSVIAQSLCHVKHGLTLPPSAFTPPPKVNSSVIVFEPLDTQPDFTLKTLEGITAKAFGQRRKMIRQSLKDYREAIEALGLDPTARAENLSVQDYLALTRCVEKKEGKAS